MKTKPQQFANTRVDVEKLATTITDRSGYEGDEANAYQSGIITGYERALGDNSKAVNMHDELISELEKIKKWFEKDEDTIIEFAEEMASMGENATSELAIKIILTRIKSLLKQAEQK